MNNINLEFKKLLSKSTVYSAIKADVENGCSKPSDNYSNSIYNYMNTVYEKKAALGITDSLNYALGYDTNNCDLISVMTIHFIKAWSNLCENYRNLIKNHPTDEVTVIKEFNKIVSSTYIRKELDLGKHCRVSEVIAVIQKDKKNGKSKQVTKRVYKEFKQTYKPLSFDQNQTNSESSDEMITLYNFTPASNTTPEDSALSSQTILEIVKSLATYPRLLLAFLSQYSGESQWDIIASLHENKTWTSIFTDSLNKFCEVNECSSVKFLFSDFYSERELAYIGTSTDMYKVLSTERNKAKKIVVDYVLRNKLYTTSNPRYTYKK